VFLPPAGAAHAVLPGLRLGRGRLASLSLSWPVDKRVQVGHARGYPLRAGPFGRGETVNSVRKLKNVGEFDSVDTVKDVEALDTVGHLTPMCPRY
jgi:hypothetical protein